MNKVQTIEELKAYLKEHIDRADLVIDSNDDTSFEDAYNSGYSTAYSDLLAVLDPAYAEEIDTYYKNNEA